MNYNHTRLQSPYSLPDLYYCDKCDRVFTSREVLAAHKKRHKSDTTEKRHRCPLCPYATNYSSHLRQHTFTHSGERPFKCTQCSAGFTQNSLLKKHMLHHEQDENFTTHDNKGTVAKEEKMKNDRSSKNSNSIDKKKQSKTEASLKPCTKCSKTFDDDKQLQKHMRIHKKKEKPHKCKVCNKRFSTSSNLTRHEKKHRKEASSKSVTKDKKSSSTVSLRDVEQSPKSHECPLSAKEDSTPTDKTDTTELKSSKRRKEKKPGNSKLKKVSSSEEDGVIFKSRQKEYRARLLSQSEEITPPHNQSESSSDMKNVSEQEESKTYVSSPVDGVETLTVANERSIEEESSSGEDVKSSDENSPLQAKNKLESPDGILDLTFDALKRNDDKTKQPSSEN